MQEKGNILIVHNYYQIPGGEDVVVANERKLLENNGYKVLLYTRSNTELKDLPKWRKVFLPFTTIYNFKTAKDVKRIIKDEHIAFVHVHNTLNLISPSVYYAAKACDVPVIQTIHNFRLLCPNAIFYRDGHICEDCLKKGLRCAIKHNCYRNSKLQTLACVINTGIHRRTGIYGKIYYICLTEFNKRKLLNLKMIQSEKVYVKPNFTDCSKKFVPGEQRDNQFVYVGRLDMIKGIDMLFKAWKLLGKKSPKLIVCGVGPMESWCKNYARENNLNVEMKGFVANTIAKDIMAKSRALILPTQWYEGFPMSIIEAYSSGTPVIGSRLGNLDSVIIDNVTGWKFETEEELCKIILTFPPKGEIYMSTYNHYMQQYTAGKNIQLLESIYNEIRENMSE